MIHPIIQVVCNHFGVSETQIVKKIRTPDIVAARYTAMVLIKQFEKINDDEVAAMFGKERTSMSEARKKTEWWVKVETEFYEDFLKCESEIKQLLYTNEK